MKTLLMLLIVSSSFADVSSDVFIKGKVGSSFDDKQVKVIDSEGQSYFLSRKVFPKDFIFKEGAPFAIEVDEKELRNLKLLKKKK